MVKKTVVRYTLDECVKCLKCVRVCPTSALSIVDNRIVIDDERCINCLHCVHTCHNKGLRVKGSPLSAIGDYDYTVCLVPSALSLRFASKEKVEEVFFRIKSLGFDEVVDISEVEGAMMEETFRIADEMVTTSIITAFCPVVNRLVERNYPTLMEHLAPLKYPSETAAKMVRARLADAGKGNVGIFHLCECGALLSIAKHPFDNMQYEVDHAVAMTDIIPLIQKDEPEGRMGVELCRAGLQSCNPALIPQRPEYLMADGFDKITDILDMAEFDLLKSFNLLYLFMCFNGCAGGNLMFGNSYLSKNNIESLCDGGYPDIPDIPFDYMYTEHMLLPEKEQHNIVEKLTFFKRVNEELEHLPGLDCSACGLKTCRIMAEEIVKGNRTRGDCRILASQADGGTEKNEDR